MALRSSNVEAPPNTIPLTRNAAINYQWNQIQDWKPQREVWPFIHGIGFLGGLAAMSGLYINSRIRRVMKLRNFGVIASGISMTICPAVLTSFTQMKMIAEKTFLPIEICPLCIEMKSIAVQNCGAVIYPSILAPVVNLLIAKRAGTFRMPYYVHWKEVLYFGVNLFKPIVPSLLFLSAINSVAATFILYKQFNCISFIHEVLDIDIENNEMETNF